jgi:tetratricopeptide (TPR) repeat protein
MSNPLLDLQKLLKLPTEVLETGLNAMGDAVRAVQTTIEGLSGQGSYSSRYQPPVNGPQNLDGALAEFGNHLVRIGRTTRPDAADLLKTAREAIASAKRSFGYIDSGDPRALALSLALPLSAGSLMAEAMLRGLVFFSILGPKRFPKSTLDFMESTSDIAPFVRLQYKDLIERHLERLKNAPEDAATRRELGRVYIKCGRYADAIGELQIAGKDPSVRGDAMYDSCVAWYRSGKFEDAIQDGIAAMTANPDNERARYWLWLAAQKLNGYPKRVPARFRMDLQAGMAPTGLRYENIAPRIGLNKTSGGRGTAIFDYNNDGLLDIAITSAHGGTSLYRNNGDGTFTDVSVESGVDRAVNGFSIIAGDYDNDGFTDLYVTRLGWYAGDGTLFHNNGDGTFTDVTAKAGVGGILPAIGSSWGDYNNDGYPDLFVSGMGHAQLLRNNGNGTFTDVSAQAGLTDPCIGTVCAWCDYDNDGWLDVAQFVWSDYEDIIQTMKTGRGPDDGKPFRIYHNNRDGTFTMKDRELGLDGCWGTMSGTFGDLDNDGNLDFVLGNGAPPMDRIEPMVVLQSDGAKFRNVTFSAGLPFTGKSHGANCADLFGDGRLSIIVAAGGLYPGDLLTSAVFCPKERTGNYLNVRLRGTKCNRDAIGARITLLTGDSSQMREVGGGANFGCLPTEQHFGLSGLTEISALEIRWPGGHVQRVENPPVNATIRIVEGKPGFERVFFSGTSSDKNGKPETTVSEFAR